MGAKQSLEDDLINFKMTSKQMGRSSAKCNKKEAQMKNKLKKAIADGNMDVAREYAQNAIREKNSALQFLRLQSRIDSVASRLEQAIRMQTVSSIMKSQVSGMQNALKSMEADKISKVMEQFEQQFEDMDVQTRHMNKTMDSTTAVGAPIDEVDELINQVATENRLNIAGKFGTNNPTNEEVVTPVEGNTMEERLAALRGKQG